MLLWKISMKYTVAITDPQKFPSVVTQDFLDKRKHYEEFTVTLPITTWVIADVAEVNEDNARSFKYQNQKFVDYLASKQYIKVYFDTAVKKTVKCLEELLQKVFSNLEDVGLSIKVDEGDCIILECQVLHCSICTTKYFRWFWC